MTRPDQATDVTTIVDAVHRGAVRAGIIAVPAAVPGCWHDRRPAPASLLAMPPGEPFSVTGLSGIDLSTIEVAIIGTELVRAGTLERLSDTFAAVGFRRSAFPVPRGGAEGVGIVADLALVRPGEQGQL
ncbi:hypothetical protein ACN27J_06545 [Solwaraspora sp. WMMB762]|uniref:hypothetical protein n=1 Tax=Solwaraspora sp. WMMB762 TaxID=3404120 RepID=UPI003B939098